MKLLQLGDKDLGTGVFRERVGRSTSNIFAFISAGTALRSASMVETRMASGRIKCLWTNQPAFKILEIAFWDRHLSVANCICTWSVCQGTVPARGFWHSRVRCCRRHKQTYDAVPREHLTFCWWQRGQELPRYSLFEGFGGILDL